MESFERCSADGAHGEQKEVLVSSKQRQKRKYVCTVRGLETFGNPSSPSFPPRAPYRLILLGMARCTRYDAPCPMISLWTIKS